MGSMLARRTAAGMALAALLCAQAPARIHRFSTKQPGTRNLGVWRLTFDPAIRDEGNYHNITCFSANGRYTCYTHWGGHEGAGGKGSAEIHVVDLMTGEDRGLGRGINPRWARNSNQLFYCHYTGDGKPPYETGTEIIRYNPDSREKVVIGKGMECPGGLDSTDTWLYGSQRYRRQKPQYRLARLRNRAGSKIERIKTALPANGLVHLNPRRPMLMMRGGFPNKNKLLGGRRTFYDLDGSNPRTGMIWAESGHACWRGDGKYMLIGNRQLCGRRWDQSYPSDLDVLSWRGSGDISPMDNAGRYACGGNLFVVDMRSGDGRYVVYPRSHIIYPMKGDNSTLMDIDAKGSPDGTKVHYHSTRDIENFPVALGAQQPQNTDVIHVDSTEGFPESGALALFSEVIGYKKKTPTTFEGLTRRMYGTRTAKRLAAAIHPLSAYVLTDEQKKRAKPDYKMLLKGKLPLTHPLVFQRQTDCYIVVVRRPFAPHLRLKGAQVELIPGEFHWETRGYRLLRDGKAVSAKLLRPGEGVSLPAAGTYTAVSVEWSGLESPPSLTLKVRGRAAGKVMRQKPADFSWTREAWEVSGKTAPRAAAMKAPKAVMALTHLHDGVIAKEEWRNGRRVSRADLNEAVKPIRLQFFENGKLKKRVYRTPEGIVKSIELFGPDGLKTEYGAYYVSPNKRGSMYRNWRFERGKLVRMVKRGSALFDVMGPDAPKSLLPKNVKPVEPEMPKPDVAKGGVALLLHFDGDFKDSSKGHNRIVNHGAVFVDKGKMGKAVRLDGKSYLDVVNRGALSMGTDCFTVEYWFKIEPKKNGPVSSPYVGSGGHGFRAGGRTSIYDSRIKRQAYCDWNRKGKYADGKWHHYAAVYDRDRELSVYIDGVKVAWTTKILRVKAPLTALNLTIGGWAHAKPQDAFNGLMDEVRITRRELRPDELGCVAAPR